jgi:hypothetical protein
MMTVLWISACSGESMSREGEERFRAGQVWRYHTRPGEEASRATILRVENDPKLGAVVHIGVSALKLKTPSGPQNAIGHLPFAASALESSVVEMVSEGPPPELPEGYRVWRQAFESGKGGVFSISVAEAVSFVEKAMAPSS